MMCIRVESLYILDKLRIDLCRVQCKPLKSKIDNLTQVYLIKREIMHFAIEQRKKLEMLGFVLLKLWVAGIDHQILFADKVKLSVPFEFLQVQQDTMLGNLGMDVTVHGDNKIEKNSMLSIDFIMA